jgi:hypothetical protein
MARSGGDGRNSGLDVVSKRNGKRDVLNFHPTMLLGHGTGLAKIGLTIVFATTPTAFYIYRDSEIILMSCAHAILILFPYYFAYRVLIS